MKSMYSVVIFLTGMLLLSSVVIAEPLSITADDNIESVLKSNDGKQVTVKLGSGDELTGTIGTVNGKLVHLRELSGKEFFDAVVSMDDISAVIIRTKK